MFDLDGTILDTRPAYIEAAKIACESTNQPYLTDEKALAIPKRMEQRLPLAGIIQGDPKKFVQVYLKGFYEISASKTRPMPNIATTLEELTLKAKLAVITMRFMPGQAILKELRQFDLDKYFAHVLTALDTQKPKPSPEALIKAVAAMDIQMCECVIAGDSTVDVMAGKAAGSRTIAVLSGLYSREELQAADPDFIINQIAELPQIIA